MSNCRCCDACVSPLDAVTRCARICSRWARLEQTVSYHHTAQLIMLQLRVIVLCTCCGLSGYPISNAWSPASVSPCPILAWRGAGAGGSGSGTVQVGSCRHCSRKGNQTRRMDLLPCVRTPVRRCAVAFSFVFSLLSSDWLGAKQAKAWSGRARGNTRPGCADADLPALGTSRANCLISPYPALGWLSHLPGVSWLASTQSSGG